MPMPPPGMMPQGGMPPGMPPGFPHGPPLGQGMQHRPPAPQAYPAVFEFLPGVASLMEDLDKRVLVTLRDGRHFVGMMRSFDQYGNVMLEDTYERHVHGDLYADERLGLYVIRGENMVLLGELDMEKEQEQAASREVTLEQMQAAKKKATAEKAEDELLRKKLQQQSLGLGGMGFDDYL
mmetsp:Transcript_10428/g.25375  ORF Transcript_10428/g.25375 Transcript_10428/m.25375 type:complete len:179 (-) Transcript_10428:57-593(-)